MMNINTDVKDDATGRRRILDFNRRFFLIINNYIKSNIGEKNIS